MPSNDTCPKCFHPLKESAQFCENCGARTRSQASSPSETRIVVAEGSPFMTIVSACLFLWVGFFMEWTPPPEHPVTGWAEALAHAECAVLRGFVSDAAEMLSSAAHPEHSRPHRRREAWSRWGVLWQRLAMKAGAPEVAEDRFHEALAGTRAEGDRFHEIPLWI